MNEHRQGGTTPADVDPDTRVEQPTAALPEGGPDEDPSERAARLERERDDYYERLLRVTAEFENFRKRTEKERREVVERAAAGVLEDLLPVIDDFERALAADASVDAEAYREGVVIIHRQLMDLLARRGVRAIEAVGGDFDPRVHQAVVYEPAPGRRDGEVVEELRRGYMVGDRLLRPSMVKVAKA